MRVHLRVFMMMLLLTAVLLAACGGEDPTPVPPTDVPPTEVLPTEVPPTDVPPTAVPTEAPPTEAPPTEAPPTEVPPTATAEPKPDFVLGTHESVDGGYSIDYPEDWFAEDLFGIGMFSSSEATFEEMGDMENLDGAVVIVMGGAMAEVEGEYPIEMLNAATDDFNIADGDVEIIEGPTAVTINDNDGAQLVMRGDADGTEIYGVLTVLTNGVNNVVIMAVVPAEEEETHAPIFDTMINSIIISEEELVDPFGDIGTDIPAADAIPAGELTYGEAVGGFVIEDNAMSWTFDGTAGSELNLFVSPTDDELDAVIDILGADGQSLLPNGEVDDSFGDENIEFSLPADGIYTIIIRGFADGGGAYTLILTEEGESSSDAGGSTGGVITYNETIEGIVPEGETISWDFEGVAGTIVDITVTPTDDTLDAVVDILDADGNSIIDGEVDDGFDIEHLSNVILPADGNYAITIRGFASGGGPYELTYLELDDSDAVTPPLSGDGISYGDQITGEIVDTAGNSWSFDARKGDFIDVTVEPIDDYDVVIDIVDNAGNSILLDGFVDESFNTEFLRAIPVSEDGQYNIIVKGFDESVTGSYELLLLETLLDAPGSIVTANNEFLNADDDGHVYPFTASADEFVTLHVNPEQGLDVAIGVYKHETDELIEEIDGYTGREEFVFQSPELDNYYFLVTMVDDTIGNYDVMVSGSNNVIFELLSGDVVYGRVAEGIAISYGYDGTAGDITTFILESDDHMDMVINLEDLDDTILVDMDDAPTGEMETITYAFDEDMSTFINVSEFFADAGNFSLSIK